MTTKKPLIPASQWAVALLFAALSIVALYLFVTFAEPPERQPGTEFEQKYTENALAGALTEARLQGRLKEIETATETAAYPTSRMAGTPGAQATIDLIERTLTKAKITPVRQEFSVVVPQTVQRFTVCDTHGTPLPGITIYPFEPSGALPIALPKAGVTGNLIATQSTLPIDLTVKKNIEGSIVVNEGLDCSWPMLASMGVKAVLMKEDAVKLGDPDIPAPWTSQTTHFDQPFPRFLVKGPIEKFAGQPITITGKVEWQQVPSYNILGVLKAKHPTQEALVISAYYDSYSIVPDYAPGAEQAISLAVMLNMVEGLAPYTETMKRDVIFAAIGGHSQSMEGVIQLNAAIARFTKKLKGYQTFEQQIAAQEEKIDYAKEALEIIDADAPWQTNAAAVAAYGTEWAKEPKAFRTWFEGCFATVAGEVNLSLREEFLQARLRWIRDDKSDALLAPYLDAKKEDTFSGDAISKPFWKLASSLEGDRFTRWAYRQRAAAYFKQIRAYHEDQVRQLKSTVAIRDLFAPYKNTLTVNFELYSGGAKTANDLLVLMGRRLPGTVVEPQSSNLKDTIESKVPKNGADPVFRVMSYGSLDAEGRPSDPNIHSQWETSMETEIWFRCARQAFTVINKTYFPAKLGTPEDRFAGLPTAGLGMQVPAVGKALLAVVHGRIPFKTPEYIPGSDPITTVRGTVYTAAGVASQVPNHRVSEHTFVHYFPTTGPTAMVRGIRQFPILQADPYGDYYRYMNFDISAWGNPVSVDAVRFNDDGQPIFFKDASARSQTIFKNEVFPSSDLTIGSEKPVNVALFRSSLITCFQRGNPKTLNAFAGFNFLQKQGMQPPDYVHTEVAPLAPGISAFLEPDCQFYIAMLDGSAANPEVQTFRAFMLNNDPTELDAAKLKAALAKQDREAVVAAITPKDAKDGELFGAGYLAADTGNMIFPYFDAAASMIRTNGLRLAKEYRYYMADEQMLESQRAAEQMLGEAVDHRAHGDAVAAVTAAGRALALTITNHPVIRTKISNAIIGILWYLGILVPFVFFFEKLAFGFTDIRKQLLAYGLIFIAVFGLLWYFHPAFQMVNQPLIILLGFLIFLLAVIVTSMVAGKFQQTIKVLRQKEGTVEGADINRAGVIGTAFMLGLNNMRRRKVRTGLTCVTLVLITFVMICFTSVSSEVTESEIPSGKSPSNGILRRDPNFTALTDNEVANLQQLFGLQYPVGVHYWFTSILNDNSLKNDDIYIQLVNNAAGQPVANAPKALVNSLITMPWNEPKFSGIDKYLVTKRGWFPKPPQTQAEIAAAAGNPMPDWVILPDTAAEKLNLTAKDIDSGHATVTICGTTYEVLGVIDSLGLTSHVGLDGQSILPYDLNSLHTKPGKAANGVDVVLPQTIGRLNGSQVAIVSRPPTPQAGAERNFPVSCAVLFPSEPYKLRDDLPAKPPVTNREQRAVISEYLERIGIPAYYAVDGVAYQGSRARARTLSGLAFLFIPILIAALTVFNTMRSSVYERKEEIYVYNAVGIAPNHIFFMFMAEASVYAVMGAMLGYLLSQVSGKVLIALHLTSGLNMDYSSIETIVASVVIVASTLLSTLVPAYTASRLALPSDEASWTVPQADGDVMTFNLPFTFTPHDRLAVISYFFRWLDANGEGSSGPFFCAPPEPTIVADPDEPNGGLVPVIATTVWLKPFDLGVSQRVSIALPTDPETQEFIARITIERLSGTAAAWNRTVMPFLIALRKQFLNWRAVSDAERAEMYEEAKAKYLQTYAQETVNG
jgi:hypothetical protein